MTWCSFAAMDAAAIKLKFEEHKVRTGHDIKKVKWGREGVVWGNLELAGGFASKLRSHEYLTRTKCCFFP